MLLWGRPWGGPDSREPLGRLARPAQQRLKTDEAKEKSTASPRRRNIQNPTVLCSVFSVNARLRALTSVLYMMAAVSPKVRIKILLRILRIVMNLLAPWALKAKRPAMRLREVRVTDKIQSMHIHLVAFW